MWKPDSQVAACGLPLLFLSSFILPFHPRRRPLPRGLVIYFLACEFMNNTEFLKGLHNATNCELNVNGFFKNPAIAIDFRFFRATLFLLYQDKGRFAPFSLL